MKITNTRTIIFLALVIVFFVRCGSPPSPAHHSFRTWRGIMEASLLFIAGACIACFGKRGPGLLPRGSPPWLLALPTWAIIAAGILIMTLGAAWMRLFTLH